MPVVPLVELRNLHQVPISELGYAANLAVMSTLGRGNDVAIFSDELNHASIIDGCKLATTSGAMLKVYRCCDVGWQRSIY